MSGTPPTLESRLEELAQVVARLEGRVAALEKGGVTARRPAARPQAAAAKEEPWNSAQVTRVLSLGGRTLLVLAGAFVLRALTDSGRLPAPIGVTLGFLYAGSWLVMADRAGRAGNGLSAAFHAVTVVAIGFPLLFEATTRFKLFGPRSSILMLSALTAAALLLASRRRLQVLAWVVSIGGIVTAVALMAAAGLLVPGALYLAALGAAALWIGYVIDWTGLRWPVALVVDLVMLLVAIHAADTGTAEGPGAALVAQSALVILYLGSFAARTLYMGRQVVRFEMVQTAAVLLVGIGGAVWVSIRSGLGQAGFGVASLVFGAASYGVAFAFVERKQKLKENFYFYTSVALVFVLAGSALLLSEPARSIVWAALAVVAALMAVREKSRMLASHSALYALCASIGSGLLASSTGALLVGGSVGWRPEVVPLVVLVAIAASTWIVARVPRHMPIERIPPVVVYLIVVLGVVGALVAWIAPFVGASGPGASAGALATLRTVMLVAAVFALTLLGRDDRHREAGWLAYPLLGFTGVKMLLEDLRHGTPASLILGFAVVGLALIFVPKLRARARAAAAAAGGAGPDGKTGT